jgi:hypothetical protein
MRDSSMKRRRPFSCLLEKNPLKLSVIWNTQLKMGILLKLYNTRVRLSVFSLRAVEAQTLLIRIIEV